MGFWLARAQAHDPPVEHVRRAPAGRYQQRASRMQNLHTSRSSVELLVSLDSEPTMTEAWWESPAVLTAVRERDTGTVIRLARRAKGATQRQTGDACGYSQSEISRIENGRARVHDIRILDRLARHLDIPPHLLGLAPVDVDPVDWSVRRRDFLKEAAAGAAVAALTAKGRDRRGLSELLVLSGPAPDESPTLAGLEKRIGSAHAIYQRGEYKHVADGLAALISSTTGGTVLAEDERSRQRVLAAQGWSFVLAAKLATKFERCAHCSARRRPGGHGGDLQRISGLAGGGHLPAGVRPRGWWRTIPRRTGCCHRCRPSGCGERPRPVPYLCARRPAADRSDRRIRSG